MSDPLLDSEQGEFIQAFVEEGREMLDEAEPLLIELEQKADPSSGVANFVRFAPGSAHSESDIASRERLGQLPDMLALDRIADAVIRPRQLHRLV